MVTEEWTLRPKKRCGASSVCGGTTNDRRSSPDRSAIDISLLLNKVLGKDRFPVDGALVAKEYSAQRYPENCVSLVIGRPLPEFDGALYCAAAGKKGWGIFYNSAITSKGCFNFTLGHEYFFKVADNSHDAAGASKAVMIIKFDELDRPALTPLPDEPYEYA